MTSEPELIPELRYITSSGVDLKNGPEEPTRRLPSDKDIRVVSPAEARALFNSNKDYSNKLNWAMRIDGMNFNMMIQTRMESLPTNAAKYQLSGIIHGDIINQTVMPSVLPSVTRKLA